MPSIRASVEENKEAMTEVNHYVKTGQVTFAVRDTSIDGVEIKKDDFMALNEGKIVKSTPDLLEEPATYYQSSLTMNPKSLQ